MKRDQAYIILTLKYTTKDILETACNILTKHISFLPACVNTDCNVKYLTNINFRNSCAAAQRLRSQFLTTRVLRYDRLFYGFSLTGCGRLRSLHNRCKLIWRLPTDVVATTECRFMSFILLSFSVFTIHYSSSKELSMFQLVLAFSVALV